MDEPRRPVLFSGAIYAPFRLIYNGFHHLQDRRRARRRFAGCSVLGAAVAEGSQVCATGTVRSLGETLTSPLSGQSCVAYRVRVWPMQPRGRPVAGGGGMQELVKICAFALEVGDERILIDGTHAEFAVPLNRRSPDNYEREQHLLLLAGSVSHDGFLSEALIGVGDRITIAGALMLEVPDEPSPDRELDYREAPPPARRISGSHELPLVFRDAPAPVPLALPSAS